MFLVRRRVRLKPDCASLQSGIDRIFLRKIRPAVENLLAFSFAQRAGGKQEEEPKFGEPGYKKSCLYIFGFGR